MQRVVWRDTVVGMGATGRARFSDVFDATFRLNAAGNNIFVGLDVLRGLVDGINDFVACRQPRWQSDESCGAVLLGSSFGLNDDDLLRAVEQLTAACIVVSKPERTQYWDDIHRELARRNEQEQPPGLPLEAIISAFRTLGFRKTAGRYPPLVHAKLALMGHLLHRHVDAPGDVEAVAFQPVRLWVSSANFTKGSHRNIEFGYWTDDPAMLKAAEHLLVRLIAESEAVDTNAEDWSPEMAPVEYDHDAMIEAMAEVEAEERYAQLEQDAQVEDWIASHDADESEE